MQQRLQILPSTPPGWVSRAASPRISGGLSTGKSASSSCPGSVTFSTQEPHRHVPLHSGSRAVRASRGHWHPCVPCDSPGDMGQWGHQAGKVKGPGAAVTADELTTITACCTLILVFLSPGEWAGGHCHPHRLKPWLWQGLSSPQPNFITKATFLSHSATPAFEEQAGPGQELGDSLCSPPHPLAALPTTLPSLSQWALCVLFLFK